MRYETWRQEHGSLTRGWWRAWVVSLSVLIIILTSVVDLATPRELTAFGLVIVVGPVLAAAAARPWAVVAVGAFGMAMAWATSTWQGLGGTAYQEVRLWVIGGMTALSAGVAYSQRALERRANRSAEDESMLAAVVESCGDAVIAADLDGLIVSWNQGAERTYGYSAAEMIGRNVVTVLPPGSAARLPHVIAEIRQGGGLSNFRTQRVHRDGHLFDVSTSVSPIRDRRGTVVGLAAIARDISAQKQAEEQRQQILERSARAERLESLGQLAGGIAHDFNNLLAINLNYLEFALEQTTDPDTHNDLTRAKASAERARDLTRQLLVFARKQPTTAQTIDLNTIITDTRTLLDRTIGTHIELITHLHPHPLPIRADRSRIEQVLLNLVINARDAMPDGGLIVIDTCPRDLVSTEPSSPPTTGTPQPLLPAGDYAQLSITDTGTGMPEDVATHVFEPFFTTKTKHHGTGLGLATVYGIITETNGTITLTTQPGVGTTFRILVPLSTTDTSSAPTADPQKTPPCDPAVRPDRAEA
ncbi:two-component system sensor histidine kinase NtrB [Krasilnikovia sp. MM14-A1259]|uniref:two-component system sensor histidine kinase NtrB n=1 Tax=Krasilnikovia sp. MM14-A1259 TaxID=3373539 RepID=UPI00381A107C